MDSQNWLAFSLFNTTHSVDSLEQDGIGGSGSGSASASASDLSMFNVYPKLEDFLGGCGSVGSGSAPLCQFSGHNQSDTAGIYDSELKTIAASFLRGYSSMTDQSTTSEPDTAPAVALLPVASTLKKTSDTFGQRTSIYRGVTRHRWTGRYEAHLWDNSCRREGQSRKGRQVYLGGYDKEDKAARAYDLAALKYWGPTTTTNFPVCNYEKELEEMKNMTRQEFVASLRRKSSGFSRGASIYRGVTRHHQHGRWQARIGRVAGNKDLYLGTFTTQEEAAEAYDIAAIKFRGLNAVTNFDMSRYDVKSIANSNLPIGGITGKTKTSPEPISDQKSAHGSQYDDRDLASATSMIFASRPSSSSTLSFALPIKQDTSDYWSLLGFQNPSQNNANKNNNGTTLFQASLTNGSGFHSLPNLNMDFSTTSAVNQNQTNNRFLNAGFVQPQNTSIPFATPINVSSNSWVAPPPHAFQTAKSNISVFQTPIYGME